ncbi:hypothetical protein TPHA_0C01810 [Tetrapisispora phaffii CBS 4417]|uniref:Protein kinase domain-containing protein n=1 Tax=Tetrapisispora phaffii (strain ATCC 24235 / CBS 4417 / NBRC 1672 / NRRL Y-8282 / UCD 70-5) TaxID=1071381 RepID=G8BRG1_TETPH|nr:hypothetical protein TPHA_0C01810 [Tetrapisispora phaffii CBS 4417]CCE62337.1 hypothetical protein TPHA_0C01810 [Tetrapisispora phaffii CBS 4417]
MSTANSHDDNSKYLNNYKFIGIIGSGASGVVYKVLNVINNKYYAIKVVLNNTVIRDKQNLLDSIFNDYFENDKYNTHNEKLKNRMILNSINFHYYLTNEFNYGIKKEISNQLKVHKHKHIISVIDIYNYQITNYYNIKNTNVTFIIYDYIEMDLFTAIVEKQIFQNATDTTLIKKIFIQICRAVKYCHENGIYHCDLKPENILVDIENEHAYLCDFGLSTTEKSLCDTQSIGSTFYMAPERVIDYETIYKSAVTKSSPTYSCDIWSLGIILTNIVCSCNLWNLPDPKKDQFFKSYMTNKSVLLDYIEVSTSFYQLLTLILEPDPLKRYGIDDIIESVRNIRSFTQHGKYANVDIYDIIDDDTVNEEEIYDTDFSNGLVSHDSSETMVSLQHNDTNDKEGVFYGGQGVTVLRRPTLQHSSAPFNGNGQAITI